jgi:hypothetical protein
MPSETIGSGRGAEVRIPIGPALRWLAGRVLDAADGSTDGGPNLDGARTKLALAQEELTRNRLARERGELVDREAARRAVFARARGERDAHRSWVLRVSPTLAAELGVDGHKLFTAFDAAMADHLRRLADMPLEGLKP